MYVIHGTQNEKLIQILQDGYINNKPIEPTMLDKDEHPEQIFTQLTFRGILEQEPQIPFWYRTGIVLEPDILCELPFYATGGIGGFKQKFQDGLKDPNVLAKGTGHLNKIPNLTQLKDIIRKETSSNTLGPVSYMHSHEILFGRKIYLQRFCKCIVIYSSNPKREQIKRLCEERKIPLKEFNVLGDKPEYVGKFKNIIVRKKGIADLIDLIES